MPKKLTNYQLLKKLEELVKTKCWKLVFNYDHEDGFFCEVDDKYSLLSGEEVADLEISTKRKTLPAAIEAAINYLENPPVRRFRM